MGKNKKSETDKGGRSLSGCLGVVILIMIALCVLAHHYLPKSLIALIPLTVIFLLIFIIHLFSWGKQASFFTRFRKPLYTGTLKSAEDYISRGTDKYIRNDDAGAIEDFTKAIELDPGSSEAYYSRALAKESSGDLNGALADLNKAIELNPEYIEAYLERGQLRNILGEFKDAIADFTKAIKLFPDEDAYFGRGEAKYELHDYYGAIADYEEVIKLSPKYWGVHSRIKEAKNKLRDLTGAQADFAKASEVSSKQSLTLDKTVVAKDELKDKKKTTTDFTQPDHDVSHSKRGSLLWIVLILIVLIPLWVLLAPYLPKSLGALIPLTVYFFYNFMLTLFSGVKQKSPFTGTPKSAKDYFSRGIDKYTIDAAGAIEDFTKAIELDPGSSKAYYSRAWAKESSGDLNGALADLNKAIELNPEYQKAYLWRGVLKYELHDYYGAITDYDEVIKLNPKNYEVNSRIKEAANKLRDEAVVQTDFAKAGEITHEYSISEDEDMVTNDELMDKKGAVPEMTRPQYQVTYTQNKTVTAKDYLHDKKKTITDFTRPDYDVSISKRRSIKWIVLILIIITMAAVGIFLKVKENKAKKTSEERSIRQQPVDEGADNGIITDTVKAIMPESVKTTSDSVNADSFYFDGNARYSINDYYGAIKSLNKAIELDSKNSMAYYFRGRARRSLQDYGGAITDFNKAIELDPKDIYFYKYRGFARFENQDYKGAISDFNKVIKLSPIDEDYEVYISRGRAKFQLKDFNAAIADFTKTIELSPDNETAYFARGMSKIKSGQKESGCSDLRKAYELGFTEALDVIKKYCQ
jgi:tetratricopeptide (TPR) repeat protein